jgi:hypothetical protein
MFDEPYSSSTAKVNPSQLKPIEKLQTMSLDFSIKAGCATSSPIYAQLKIKWT